MSEKSAPILMSAPARRNRSLALAFTVIAFTYVTFSVVKPFLFGNNKAVPRWVDLSSDSQTSWGPPADADEKKDLVPFEAHIMSKCSDAQFCLKEMVLPAMQRVYDKVDFTLSYIGTPTENDGVDCKHGPGECMGNIIELCAAHLYTDPKIYLGFTMCLTRDYKDIPGRSLVEDCALEHGIDFQELNECSSSESGIGIGMLRDSVKRSIDAGVTKSCTVRVNSEIYCIRDDNQWKECPNGSGVNDLVIAIEKLYKSGSAQGASS